MKLHRLTVESALYALALLLGVGLRALRLGASPLSEYEAGWALQALQISRGEPAALGSQPGYALLTGLAFFLLGGGNAAARLWSALAGSCLVGLPALLRPYFGKSPAGRAAGLFAAFGLALDPGLVALSRQAGGPMLAVGFGLLALAFLAIRRPVLGGVLAGLALLGGSSIWMGALGLALAVGAGLAFLNLEVPGPEQERLPPPADHSLRQGLLAAGGALLLAGTLFFRNPQGLGALAETPLAYLGGWLAAPEIPMTRLLAALAFYQPLALLFGLVAAVRGWADGESRARWLSLWFVGALLLALLYPARQVGDLAWALVPLWGLAGLELARHAAVLREERLPSLGQAALVFLLLVLAWLNLAGLNQAGIDAQVYRLRWAVIGGTLLLGMVTGALVALGWSVRVAERGLAWGAGVALGLFTLAASWGAAQLRQNAIQELWVRPPGILQAGELVSTLEELSHWRTGQREALDVLVTSDSPALRWLLRDWEKASFRPGSLQGALPEVIIGAGEESAPSLAASYRGQDFAWQAYPDWQGSLPLDWPRWLAFRQAPQRVERVILWARGDLFPGGSLAPAEEPPPDDEEQEDIVPAGEPGL